MEEVQFLRDHYGRGRVWIGGTDNGTHGTWEWNDGSPFDFTYWRYGHPSPSHQYNRIMINFLRYNGKWSSYPHKYGWPYICQIVL